MSSWGRRSKGNLVQKTLGLKEQVHTGELHDNSIIMNEIDKEIYHDMVDRYEVMQENLDNGLKEYAPFDNLSEDMFNSLYRYNAKLRDADEMKDFNRFNHGIMDELMESDDYQKLRKSTKFDMMASAIGTEVMQNKAMEKIQYFKQQYALQQQTGQKQPGADAGELIEQLNQQKNIQNQIDALNDKASSGTALSAAERRQLAKLQKQLTDLQDLIDDNEDGQQQLQNGVTDAMEDGAKSAFDEVHEIKDTIEAWGLDSGQNDRKISLGQRKKAIERIRRSTRLREMTDLIGRMRKIALKKKSQRIPDGHSIETIELGNKLENVIPSELMKLASPATKLDFVTRYHQKKLLQYKKDGRKSVGQGPVIVCHDKSWSMQGAKDNWSTALCLATLEVAQKEKRNYAYIPYESRLIERMIKNIPAGELDPDDVMDIAEFNVQGGTNFMAPLNEAVNCLRSDRYKKGDILFITDGEADIDDDWLAEFLKAKQDLQFYVNTILINVGGGASKACVEKFSDNIMTLSKLTDLDDSSAAKIFNMLEDTNKHAQVVSSVGTDSSVDDFDADDDDDTGY